MREGAIWNPERETMPRREIEQLQLERLQATMNRAYRNVRHYRRMFEVNDLVPEDIASLEDLRKLPFTTKQDMRDAYPYGMFALPLREVVRIHSSSGTTGLSTVVGYTRNDLEDWTELVARNLVAGGVTKDDVVQIFFGYGLFSGGFGLHQGAELIGASVLPVSSADIESQVKVMQDFRTTALVGIPSYALQIAQAMDEVGVAPSSLCLRVGLFGGEPWSQRTRQEIEERLRIRATDIYGLAEVGGPGVSGECEFRCGLHVAEDHFIVEVIDPETGEVLPPGEEGELVFTTVHKEAMPVLRYRTGDISSIDLEPCACGRTFARMANVRRRTDDMVIIHGRNIFPEDIAAVIDQAPGLGPNFRMIAERRGAEDTLRVEVELSSVLSEDTIRAIERLDRDLEERLLRVFGFEIGVHITEPRSLSANGEKRAVVIDNRKI
ncbi:MAG: phenylacetate--CoA ligase [Armatimonadetes bacterium]|nr:phenylacetate--CoA ligase [Armatimonadota bacterium]